MRSRSKRHRADGGEPAKAVLEAGYGWRPIYDWIASYTGLVPSTYASGKRITHGRLTREGNKWLRWAFVEAASPAIRSSQARRGTKDARTATARKRAELAWTERREYEER